MCGISTFFIRLIHTSFRNLCNFSELTTFVYNRMLWSKISTLSVVAAKALALGPFAFDLTQNVVSLSQYSLDSAFSNLQDYVVDNKYSLLQLHRILVQHQSISGGEIAVGHWLCSYLKSAGFTVELQRVEGPERYNVYAYLGSQRNTSVVVTSHIDTVPPFIPYLVHGTDIRGRGTCDAKGSVATQIIAVLDLISSGKLKEGDVSLLFVVGEENSGSGMRAASDGLGASWGVAIFGEPTENKLAIGHKGIVLFEIEVVGHASHSGYPELGVSATEILVPILYKLQNLELPSSDLLGPSTINIGMINAGVAANVVPGYGKATVAIRVADDLDEIVRLVHSVVDGVEHVQPLTSFGLRPQFLDYDVPGFDSIVVAYTTDVPNLTLPLKKRFLYGPGSIHVAHGDDEFVSNQDLLDAVDGYKRLIGHALSL